MPNNFTNQHIRLASTILSLVIKILAKFNQRQWQRTEKNNNLLQPAVESNFMKRQLYKPLPGRLNCLQSAVRNQHSAMDKIIISEVYSGMHTLQNTDAQYSME